MNILLDIPKDDLSDLIQKNGKFAYSVREAAKILGVSSTHIRKELGRGIKARRMGKKILILQEDLESFMKSLPLYDNPLGVFGFKYPKRRKYD